MRPNDGVAVSSGTGVDLPTQLIDGKEYQVAMMAGAAGYLTNAKDTHMAWVNNSAFAANKYHVSILNATGSGSVLRLHKLFAVNLQVAGVTGVAARFDAFKTTAHSGGTLITPQKFDTAIANLHANITVRTAPTAVTLGNRLFGFTGTNEEVGATTQLNLGFTILQGTNLLFESDRIQELILRPGEGFAMRQITSSTVGSYGWLLVFTEEAV
jgi:hypothetical protein